MAKLQPIERVRAPEADALSSMVLIPGGTFLMGSDKHYPEEAPVHRVSVGEFWMVGYLLVRGVNRRALTPTPA